MADGCRVTTAEVSTDGGEAQARVQPDQVHGQVPRLNDRCLSARPAEGGHPHTEPLGHCASDLVDSQPGRCQLGFLAEDRGHGGKVKCGRRAGGMILAGSPTWL